jgi:DNA-binding response OmpR family regulator
MNTHAPERKLTETIGSRVLLVDDYESVRTTMAAVLEQEGFVVVTAANVPDALRLCCTEKFDLLLCDLHMPGAGDGFTVVSAMRHCNPEAVNMLYSAYPALHAAMSDILMQADEILVKPLLIPELLATIRKRLSQEERLRNPRRLKAVPGDDSESVASLLKRETLSTIAHWLERVKCCPELISVSLTDAERTAHLPKLFSDLHVRLASPNPLEAGASNSTPARLHGEIRRKQNYTASMIVEESRLLQVSIFRTLQANLHLLDFSHLLLSVMTIADEVDTQLKQAMDSFVQGDKDAAKIPAKSTVFKVEQGAGDQLRRNTRIILGNYVAEIFVDDDSAVFHWRVQQADVLGVLSLGEQSTYDIARQEAEHHLTRLVASRRPVILHPHHG